MRKNFRARLAVIFTLIWLGLAPVDTGAQQASSLAKVFDAIRSGEVTVADLTHPLDDQSPFWPEGKAQSPFHASVAAMFDRDGYFARELAMPEHFGTHMDAPAHFDPHGPTVEQIAPEKFLEAAIVVDVSQAVKTNTDYRVTPDDIERWEKAHGAIPSGCVVLFRTGWSARWPSQQDYMNQDAQGVLHFPGISVEAARYLLERAHPTAVGIDTPSVDYGPSKNFEVHRLTMSAGLYHLENVANLGQLPPRAVYLVALPLKLGGGSGSPTRVLALFSKSR